MLPPHTLGLLALLPLIHAAPGTLASRVLPAILVTVVFTLLARSLRAVDLSGAVAGAVVAFLLYLTSGPGAFAGLFSVFAITWLTTRLGWERKHRLGMAERRSGRSASQVLANLGAATVLSVAAMTHARQELLVLAMVATLAEAATDTASSECGEALTDKVYLITTFKPVAVGTNGGISIAGTLAGMVAAVLVAVVCAAVKLIQPHWIAAAAGAGVAGMLADSLLGATLERRRLLGNDAVNFLGTLVAAGVAMLMVVL